MRYNNLIILNYSFAIIFKVLTKNLANRLLALIKINASR